MNKYLISLVVPCYNEENLVATFTKRSIDVLEKIGQQYEVIFVNDGSKDNTLEVLKSLKNSYNGIRIVNLSRNFGKEAALTAGLDFSLGDVVIPIDADLQHPPEIIEEFIKEWENGYDVVLAKRTTRTNETFSKKISARLFYKLQSKISEIYIPEDVGDFRLMSRKVVNALSQLPENQRFMKGLFAWVGFKSTTIQYEVANREMGTSSFNSWKLWNFALEGITSFSTVPLRIWFYIGGFVALIAFLFGCSIILKTLIYGVDMPGYASMMTVVLFLGGIQLIGIGVLGEYIGRIYMESKRRPTYIIEQEY
jgi:glycosyltransferase involved in cell wall biosynthesis